MPGYVVPGSTRQMRVRPRTGVVPLASGIFPWDTTQPPDNMPETNYPALNRSDKAVLAQILGTLAPQGTATMGHRMIQDGNQYLFNTWNASLAAGNFNYDDATQPAFVFGFYNAAPTIFGWYFAPPGANPIVWQLLMSLAPTELIIGPATTGDANHVIHGGLGTFSQNAGVASGSWAPDLASVDAFHLFFDATNRAIRFQYAANPVPSPIVWTDLAQLDATNGLMILNGATVIVARDPINPMEVATKQYVDSQIAVGAGGGMPPGGTAGELLTKVGTADFAADWETADGGTY